VSSPLQAYEHEVRSRGPAVSHEMDAMLKALRHLDEDGSDGDDGAGDATPTSTTTVVTPVPIKVHFGFSFDFTCLPLHCLSHQYWKVPL
jgi:hypothetical protein